MNSSPFDSQRHDSLKRRWQERRSLPNINNKFVNSTPNTNPPHSSLPFINVNPNTKCNSKIQCSFPSLIDDDDLVSAVVPPVTVVLEGRSICQRISLHKHASYHSLAKALRQMFVDGSDQATLAEDELDLSNAIPGHLIAYEDMENDLLLAGDLNWKDFVRVAKRIRILPVKGNSRKRRGGP